MSASDVCGINTISKADDKQLEIKSAFVFASVPGTKYTLRDCEYNYGVNN